MLLTIEELRQQYAVAVESADHTEHLLSILQEHVLGDQADWLAYRAATEALKAKHTFNPLAKLGYVKQAERTFEEAVSQAPTNVEIRFLRFSVQHHLPSFLGMSQDLEDDKEMIIGELAAASLPEDLKRDIADFLLQSGRCYAEEVEQLRNVW